MSNTESSVQAFSVSGELTLAAIMFTDIVGFSRQMGVDEARMMRLLEIHNQIDRQAVRLNPRHPVWGASHLATLGSAYRLTGQYDKAIETLKKAMSMHPSGGGALSLIATYSEAGQDAEANALAEQVLQKNPQFSLATFEGAWRRVARARAQVPRSAARRVPVSGWLA